jgi:hypothetical protein
LKDVLAETEGVGVIQSHEPIEELIVASNAVIPKGNRDTTLEAYFARLLATAVCGHLRSLLSFWL